MFIEKPVSKKSVLRRGGIYGAGINDAPYRVRYRDSNGKSKMCPFFQRWKNMVQRVYSQQFIEKQPTYSDCTIAPAWLFFMSFRAWMITQDWEDKALDKDILIQGNREYGPTTCIFISQALNSLLCLRQNFRGALPLGVSIAKVGGKKYIQAQCSFYGKNTKLGYFPSIEDAAVAYKKAKLAYISELAAKEPDPRIKQALLRLF